MKKVLLFVFIAASISLLFSGCSSRGMMTAGHNGKKYWNPGNCSQYKYSYSNPDVLRCVHNGEETGQILTPASRQQVADDRYEKEQTSKAWDSLNRSLQKTNENMRKQNEAFMPKRYDVYHHY